MIAIPYLCADSIPSRMVASSASPSIETTEAPDFAAISTSIAPVSIVFISATIGTSGKVECSTLTACIPSLFISGVPTSSQSAPPSKLSLPISIALSSSSTSNATCSIFPSSLSLFLFFTLLRSITISIAISLLRN